MVNVLSTIRLLIMLPLVLVAVLISVPVEAAVYKYEGPDGVIHYTNHPIRTRGYNLLWRSAAFESHTSTIDVASFRRNRKRYTSLITKAAERYKLRPELLHAVVRVESLYDPNAKSKAGAVGLMQLMPETAKRYGVGNRRDPEANVNGGAQYLRDLLERYQYDVRLALAAYNAGESAVSRYGETVPPYPETQNYVRKVLGFYQDAVVDNS